MERRPRRSEKRSILVRLRWQARAVRLERPWAVVYAPRPTEGCPAVAPWQARFEQHGLRGTIRPDNRYFGYSKPLTNPLGLAVARQLKYRPIKTARPHVAAPFLRLERHPGHCCRVPGASKRGLEGRGSRRYRHDAGQRHRPGHALAGARQGAVCEPADGASRHRLTVPACLR
jgi:hypothetical protein